MKQKRKVINGESKNRPTPKQNKWNNGLFKKAVLGRAGHKPLAETWMHFLKRKGVKLPKGVII